MPNNVHWCRLDLLPDDHYAYRVVCACGWASPWTRTSEPATEAGLSHLAASTPVAG